MFSFLSLSFFGLGLRYPFFPCLNGLGDAVRAKPQLRFALQNLRRARSREEQEIEKMLRAPEQLPNEAIRVQTKQS